MLLVRLPFNTRLLVVKFLGSQKKYTWIFDCMCVCGGGRGVAFLTPALTPALFQVTYKYSLSFGPGSANTHNTYYCFLHCFV